MLTKVMKAYFRLLLVLLMVVIVVTIAYAISDQKNTNATEHILKCFLTDCRQDDYTAMTKYMLDSNNQPVDEEQIKQQFVGSDFEKIKDVKNAEDSVTSDDLSMSIIPRERDGNIQVANWDQPSEEEDYTCYQFDVGMRYVNKRWYIILNQCQNEN